eukprot:scaffold7375_cov268-Pinguiococcus_pyrenoidosus.AAC.55
MFRRTGDKKNPSECNAKCSAFSVQLSLRTTNKSNLLSTDFKLPMGRKEATHTIVTDTSAMPVGKGMPLALAYEALDGIRATSSMLLDAHAMVQRAAHAEWTHQTTRGSTILYLGGRRHGQRDLGLTRWVGRECHRRSSKQTWKYSGAPSSPRTREITNIISGSAAAAPPGLFPSAGVDSDLTFLPCANAPSSSSLLSAASAGAVAFSSTAWVLADPLEPLPPPEPPDPPDPPDPADPSRVACVAYAGRAPPASVSALSPGSFLVKLSATFLHNARLKMGPWTVVSLFNILPTRLKQS